MADWTTNLTFSEDATFNTEFSGVETFDTTMDQVVQVITSDHRELNYRDADNQHPISAITDLSPELGVRPSSAMSNMDIQNIMNS